MLKQMLRKLALKCEAGASSSCDRSNPGCNSGRKEGDGYVERTYLFELEADKN